MAVFILKGKEIASGKNVHEKNRASGFSSYQFLETSSLLFVGVRTPLKGNSACQYF